MPITVLPGYDTLVFGPYDLTGAFPRTAVLEPHDLERVIHKSKRVVDTLQAAIGSVEIQASIDTIHPASIDTVHPMSIDTVQPTSIDTIQLVSDNTVHNGTIHSSTVHRGTVHLDTIYPASIDTVHPASIDTVHLPSIDTAHSASFNTVHPDTVHPDTVHPDAVHPHTVHPDTVHPVKNNTTCGETEKIEVLILKARADLVSLVSTHSTSV
ncbi:hypothetical protein DY000_02040917 [Brassica cretica]|uniref:Uncharacterized protein n=1 Tax=Brassica cretica TaxID=69181 RepID=A0ABQ7BLM2_BRACR|nr:hypothetical protein DY000_02040917 [Brassica cretica]